ncbi:hypothetical protein FBZ89_11822 [Nitrospirillum amazonense]|uniref:Sel1 repeat-containing protein n=1 Tax=Nitrospirillum amazonense TaxID=28077 RepID=A0A560EX74_9PROT|nr:sel1 repeat family protein [Nitrospirillum amazonense]TWB13971.1 hypothetical protein FBZ89_11822 [Nitrospirillum amazonense]
MRNKVRHWVRTAPAVVLAMGMAACGGAPQGDPLLTMACPAAGGPVPPSKAYDDLDARALEAKADHGDLAAARVLGERYRAGVDVAVDPVKALAWTRRAAVVEHTTTQFIMAPAVGKQPGYTVPVNQTALSGGDPLALIELGMLYAQGQGVPRSDTIAAALTLCGRQGI